MKNKSEFTNFMLITEKTYLPLEVPSVSHLNVSDKQTKLYIRYNDHGTYKKLVPEEDFIYLGKKYYYYY